MNKKLIYDVGMHNGEDTAYYLHEGFNVVSIEANPDLVAKGRERFSKEISAGRLTILPYAIAPENGPITLWINDEKDDWSALDQAVASKGHDVRGVEVEGRTFQSILKEYGIPFYLKIDIELSDFLCLEAIDPKQKPKFLSIEIHEFKIVPKLEQLGYTKFKLANQVMHNANRPHDWEFEAHSSGRISNQLKGSWLSAGDACYKWMKTLQCPESMIDKDMLPKAWYDIHATY